MKTNTNKLLIALVLVIPIFTAPPKSSIKWVEPKQGIKLFRLPRSDSQVVATVPYQAQIQILFRNEEMVEIQKRRGHWAIIKWHDLVGWTFDEDLVWGNYINTKTVEINQLIWQRCSVGQTPDEYCTGQALGISLDFEASNFKGEKLISGPFIEACEALNKQSFAGRGNWRLPTALELKTLVRCTAGPQTPLKDFKKCNEGSVYPTIDATIFPNTSPNMYVTSDRSPAPYRDTVLSVHFEVGSTASSYSNYAMLGLVRCVSEKQ